MSSMDSYISAKGIFGKESRLMPDFTSAQAKQQLIKYEQAIPIFQPLAENGDEKAQYFLGVSYWYIAYLTPQITKEEIVQWTEKAMDQFEKAYNQHGSLAGVAAYGIAKCYLCWFEQVWNPIRPYFDSFCKRKIKKRSSYQKKYQEDKKLAEDLCGHVWHWARIAAELDHQKGKELLGQLWGGVYFFGKNLRHAVEWYDTLYETSTSEEDKNNYLFLRWHYYKEYKEQQKRAKLKKLLEQAMQQEDGVVEWRTYSGRKQAVIVAGKGKLPMVVVD